MVLVLLLGIPTLAQASHREQKSDLRLTIAAPESRHVRVRRRHGIKTIKYINRSGVLSATHWPLVFRIESRTAVGFAAKKSMNQEREAMVLTDPDECFHLGSLLDDVEPPVFDFTCPFEDETYIELQTEKFDGFGVFDNPTTGNDAIRARLVDEPFSGPEPRNTPYLRMFNGSVKSVGPKTGGPLPSPDPMNPNNKPDQLDGYGYGADDDLASMVLIADVGGARVFDENFDLVPGVVRNIAGFISMVSAEDIDGRGQTAITASMHVLAGVFEPIAIVDAGISDPSLAGYEYAIRVDSGPVKGFNLDAPFPPDFPGAANDFYDELLSQYYPATVKIRAVLVNGEAPDYIYDMDGNGRYTARDVQLAGFQLLSNEVEMKLELTQQNLLTESPDSKCPPRTFIHSDLDGDASRGKLPECIQTSGSARSRRAPR
jgi:hypothetical protein